MKKNRERRHANIAHIIANIAPSTLVGKGFAGLRQGFYQRFNHHKNSKTDL